MEIIEIVNKIKREYPEIDWGRSKKGYRSNSQGRIIVQYEPSELKELYDNRGTQRSLLIHYFTESVIVWKKELQNYFAITELVAEPSAHIELTKGGKLKEIDRELGKNYFKIEQDFFITHFIKVEKNSNSYWKNIENIIMFQNLQTFIDNIRLSTDSWDDYGYKTVLNLQIWKKRFILRVNPNDDTTIKYLKNGGEHPEEFFCSLGEIEYYEFLKKYLSYQVREQWFSRIKDLAYNITLLDTIAEKYKELGDPKAVSFKFTPPYGNAHNFFNNSFMRTTTIKEIKETFHPLTIAGRVPDNKFDVPASNMKRVTDDTVLGIAYSFDEGNETEKLYFEKNKSSFLPMNVYAIVGGNGSGKSYKINDIIKKHLEGDNNFSQILHFSLSPFDNDLQYTDQQGLTQLVYDKVIDNDGELLYEKIGMVSVRKPPIKEVQNKAPETCRVYLEEKMKERGFLNEAGELSDNFEKEISIKESFIYYIQNLLFDLIASPEKLEMWKKSLEFFMFEPWVVDIRDAFQDRNISLDDIKKIEELSSGQATILLYLTKLVSSINQGSLVIFDEPETFMHPPMIKSFIRAVSEVVNEKKVFCLIATHSPIIIQEIPHCNIYRLNLEHKLTKINYKTYGQNLDTLYKNIYGVELQQTGYNSLFNDRREHIVIKEEEDVIIYQDDEEYLGDEAFLKYVLLKDEIKERGESLSKE